MGVHSISVVVPSFNHAQFLQQALQSIADQHYSNLEVLVLDGGSTDGSRTVIESFDDLVTYWRSSPDGGQTMALLEGFQQAKGDILCWLNSDDTFLPGCLAAVDQVFTREADIDVVAGTATFIDAESRETERYPVEQRTFERMLEFWNGWPIAQPATFFRRRAYDRVSGIKSYLSYAMDLDLFLRMSLYCRFRYIDRELATYRIHGDSKTSNWRATRILFWREAARVTRPFWPTPGSYRWWRYACGSAYHLAMARFDHWRLTRISDMGDR